MPAHPIARYTRWLHTQWPAGLTEKGPEVNNDGTCTMPGVRIVGDLTGIPLLKFSADSGARAVQAILAEPDFAKGGKDGTLDLAIVGAGVAGMSAAIEAKHAGLNFRLLEAGDTFSTIRNFPNRKPIYTFPTGMTPAGRMHFEAGVKEALVEELEQQQAAHGIETTDAAITRIERAAGHLLLHRKEGEPIPARRVIVAIGRTGNFRKLNVPGENLEKVSNRLIDPSKFAGRKVLVVGGGDSALEAAIALCGQGAQVDLSYRKPEFSRAKSANVEKLRTLAEDGKIALHLPTNVQRIDEESVTLSGMGKEDFELANDFVFTLIGRKAPLGFFRRSGIPVTGDKDARFWFTIAIAFLFCFWLYHWKSGGQLPFDRDYPNWLNPQPGRWYSALGGWWQRPGTFGHTLKNSASDPGFYYSLAYCSCVLLFGLRRIRRRRTPYITWQTAVLILIQWIPLFLLPYLLLPWLGAQGAFTSGGFGEWFGRTFFSDGPGTEPTSYWRSFGFILAWPLFIWNIFTGQPLWGWLALGFIQTFVFIPLIVWRWGKGAYCGWICSCGALAETMGDAHRHKMPHGPFWNRLNMVGQGVLLFAFVILLLRVAGWLVPSSGIDAAYQSLLSGLPILNYGYLVDLWLAGILGVAFYFHFSGRIWCRFACPLAALMHIYARFTRFRIFPEKERCISCNVCTTVCHQGIDVMSFANRGRPMEDPQCVRCSACVQSCPTGVLQFGRYADAAHRRIVLDTLPASPVLMAESQEPTSLSPLEHRNNVS